MKKEIVIPKKLDEAIAVLDKELSRNDKKFLLVEGALAAHHSLGRWIRNNWGLWESSELKGVLMDKGFSHPDDMSNYIIEEYIKYLKKK